MIIQIGCKFINTEMITFLDSSYLFRVGLSGGQTLELTENEAHTLISAIKLEGRVNRPPQFSSPGASETITILAGEHAGTFDGPDARSTQDQENIHPN